MFVMGLSLHILTGLAPMESGLSVQKRGFNSITPYETK